MVVIPLLSAHVCTTSSNKLGSSFLKNTHLEGELVDGVDLVQIVQDEVHEGRPGGGRSVQLSRLVDLDLGDLGLFYLDLDLGGSALGGLQVLNEGGVTQEVALSRGETGEEIVFQLLQDDLEIVLLLGQVQLIRGDEKLKSI